MKLNIGCGYNKKQGYLNVDSDASCQPDLLFDLEQTPWPFENEQFDEILADHSLEHMGQTTQAFINIMKEMYRVLKPSGHVFVTVPHPRHDNYIGDPTHCRVITPVTLALFDQKRNQEDLEKGGQESKLGFSANIDFELVNAGYDFAPPWSDRFKAGQITQAELFEAMANFNNVCYQIKIILKAHKPTRIK